MSEYMMSPQKKTSKPAEEVALFDDLTFVETKEDSETQKLEHVVDTQGISYADARRKLGIEVQAYEPEIARDAESHGASVELGARALALGQIMDVYNQLNKNMGATIVRQYANNPFDTRYDDAGEVKENMGRRAAAKLKAIKGDFDTLTDREGLLAQGFDPDDVDRIGKDIQSDLLNKYGPGKAYAPDRAKVVRRAATAAKKGNMNNKRK